jgi:hypothetical protein
MKAGLVGLPMLVVATARAAPLLAVTLITAELEFSIKAVAAGPETHKEDSAEAALLVVLVVLVAGGPAEPVLLIGPAHFLGHLMVFPGATLLQTQPVEGVEVEEGITVMTDLPPARVEVGAEEGQGVRGIRGIRGIREAPELLFPLKTVFLLRGAQATQLPLARGGSQIFHGIHNKS